MTAVAALSPQSGAGGAILVSLSAGASVHVSAASASHTFGANTATPTGGTAPYTYLWSDTNDGLASWTLSGSATSVCTPAVSGLGSGSLSLATVACLVTDARGLTGSASTHYRFDNTSGGSL